MGHSRRSDSRPATSGLSPSADIARSARHFRFVPEADIGKDGIGVPKLLSMPINVDSRVRKPPADPTSGLSNETAIAPGNGGLLEYRVDCSELTRYWTVKGAG